MIDPGQLIGLWLFGVCWQRKKVEIGWVYTTTIERNSALVKN
jgi:hypothetical protein